MSDCRSPHGAGAMPIISELGEQRDEKHPSSSLGHSCQEKPSEGWDEHFSKSWTTQNWEGQPGRAPRRCLQQPGSRGRDSTPRYQPCQVADGELRLPQQVPKMQLVPLKQQLHEAPASRGSVGGQGLAGRMGGSLKITPRR